MLRNSAAPYLIAVFLALSFFAPGKPLAAHDIPNDVTVQVFFKPAGNQLNVLVRVPLKTMRDVEFPERDQGYLDFDRVDPSLREAATLWISDFIDVYEGATLLPKPRVVQTRLSLESDPSFCLLRDSHRAPERRQTDESNHSLLGPDDAGRAVSNIPFNPTRRISRFILRLERLGARVVTVLRFLPPGRGGPRI